jgi:hypothetical protein
MLSPVLAEMEANVKNALRLACFVLLLSLAVQAAEIEKRALVCQTGICLYWWPKLPQIKGWHQDKNFSYRYGVDALAPDGFTFSNAVAVMYANAAYKPRDPETKSLQMFIANDQRGFRSSDPGIKITEISPLANGDGVKMPSYMFVPKAKGNWEQVTYAAEGDYYLTFVLSSRSKSGFQKAEDAYRKLISGYKAKM